MRNPVTGGELTAEWLAEALAATTGGADIAALEVERLAAEDSLFSVPMRLHVSWRGGTGPLPSTLFVKAVAPGGAASELAASLGVLEREARFYTELAPQCGVRAPRCWFAWAQPDATLLILDDLSDQRAGDGVEGLCADDARLVLEALARMHGRWWSSSRLDGLDWLDRTDAAATRALDRGARQLLPAFVDRCGADLDAIEEAVLAEVAADASAWRAPLLESPHATLLHGDVKPGNLFFADDEVTFIDWQGVKVASPAFDVASLLGSGIATAPAGAGDDVVADLLDAYASALRAAGGSLDERRWRDELRLAAHAMLLPCIAAAEVVDDHFASILAVTARRRVWLALSLRQN